MSTVLPRGQTETTGGFPAGLTFTSYAAFRVSEALSHRPRADLAAPLCGFLGSCVWLTCYANAKVLRWWPERCRAADVHGGRF